MKHIQLIRGNLCWSSGMDTIACMERGWLAVEDGVIEGVYRTLPERLAGCPTQDFGDALVLPGMTDLHVHAPQFAFRGLGMDMELLEWLNTYTFPEEAKYRDLAYAERAYSSFVTHLLHSTTTRAVVFATIHLPATELLMRKLDDAGLAAYVGKVNMNRSSPDYLRELSTNHALCDTERWILETKDAFRTVRPIITPRFIPSCTDDLMFGLARLREKYGLPVQSHLSENYSEIAWIRELCPKSKNYGDAYDQFGMFGGGYPCIMAHCVHSDEREQELIARNGVFVAHAPESVSGQRSSCGPFHGCSRRQPREHAPRRHARHPGVQAPLAPVRPDGEAAVVRAGVLSGHHGRRRVFRTGRHVPARLCFRRRRARRFVARPSAGAFPARQAGAGGLSCG